MWLRSQRRHNFGQIGLVRNNNPAYFLWMLTGKAHALGTLGRYYWQNDILCKVALGWVTAQLPSRPRSMFTAKFWKDSQHSSCHPTQCLRGRSSLLKKMEDFLRSSRTNTRLWECTLIPSLLLAGLLGLCPCLSDLDHWTSTQRASVVPQQQMCS